MGRLNATFVHAKKMRCGGCKSQMGRIRLGNKRQGKRLSASRSKNLFLTSNLTNEINGVTRKKNQGEGQI